MKSGGSGGQPSRDRMNFRREAQVSVENSAIVYDDGAGTVSTIVCNWFGAGSACQTCGVQTAILPYRAMQIFTM